MALLTSFIILKLLPLILLAFFFSNFTEKIRIITCEFYRLLPSSALWKTLLSEASSPSVLRFLSLPSCTIPPQWFPTLPSSLIFSLPDFVLQTI